MILTNYIEVLRSPAQKIRGLGWYIIIMSGGKLYQNLAVRGKNEYIFGLIHEKGMVNLCLREGCMSWGRGILTRL